MNTDIANDTQVITSTKVATEDMGDTLPTLFPHLFLVFENSVYSFMEKICAEYQGGFWEFYTLSNGGFYMAPLRNKVVSIAIPFGNDFSDKLSMDAAGIVATLMAYCQLSEVDARMTEHYHRLLEFARLHTEANKILAAID